jgi:hypothetical protein
MATHNPYAPSRATLKVGEIAGSSEGVRREGKWIVMPLDGVLPHRCVKCNAEPQEPARQRTLYWHHPAVYLVIVFNIIIYAIVAAVVRRKIKVSPALCMEHAKQRRKIIIFAWLGILAAIVLPFMLANTENAAGWLMLCILLFIVAGLVGVFRSRLLYAKKIDGDEARLGGAGADYLDSLPE